MTDNETPAVQTGPRVQRREAWVEMPDAYSGFRARIWLNAPGYLWADMEGKAKPNETEEAADARSKAAASKIVLEHNGWLDFDGNAYPPATDPQFWEQLPTELTSLLVTVARLEVAKLPNSVIPKRKR